MLTTDIDKIIVKDRIRKEVTGVFDLAEDMMKNGLLNPITVMSLGNGTYQLLAGLRRLKAAQALGWGQILANDVSPADAEAALRIEISENEQREPFTYSEKMDFARMLEEIEKAKAKDRQTEGQSLGGMTAARHSQHECFEDGSPQSVGKERQPQVRDIVGEKIGMSGRQYDRAKYVTEKAPPEVIDQIDKGECSINKAYDKLRAKEPPKVVFASERRDIANDPFYQKLEEESGGKTAYVPLEEQSVDALIAKIKELEDELFKQCAQIAHAESELSLLKNTTGISIDHKTSIIEGLQQHNTQLIRALEESNLSNARLKARIAELEGET